MKKTILIIAIALQGFAASKATAQVELIHTIIFYSSSIISHIKPLKKAKKLKQGERVQIDVADVVMLINEIKPKRKRKIRKNKKLNGNIATNK